MRTILTLAILLAASISNANEESDITVASAAAQEEASGKCEPNAQTAVGIVTTVVEGKEKPVMITPISQINNYTLSAGAPVLWNSKIVTDATSKVVVTLADSTVLVVGPNSEITMDKFIFDPCKKGITAADALKGFARLVGGAAQKGPQAPKEGSNGYLGIRG